MIERIDDQTNLMVIKKKKKDDIHGDEGDIIT